jgi:hypothetical protein
LLTFILLVGNKFSRRNIRINLEIATSFLILMKNIF